MWWIFGIIVVVYIIYSVNKDHKEYVDTNISQYGGMLNKYNLLIGYIQHSGGCKIQKANKESVLLGTSSMSWRLDDVGYNLEVRMKGFVPILGNVSKKWVFQNGYPQEKMIEEIENFLDWQMNELKKIAKNNPYEHINIK